MFTNYFCILGTRYRFICRGGWGCRQAPAGGISGRCDRFPIFNHNMVLIGIKLFSYFKIGLMSHLIGLQSRFKRLVLSKRR